MNILSIEKIIRIAAYRNKYDLLSNDIAKRVFESVKGNYQSRINIGDSFYYGQNEDTKEEYIVDYFVKFINSKDIKRNVKANFEYPDPEKNYPATIDIKIVLGLSFSEDDMERLYWHLYEAIRHEYEHYDKYTQNLWPDEEYKKTIEALKNLNLPDMEKVKLVSKLILHPIEIDSFARSIMYVAKKRKISYGYVMRDILNRILFHEDKNIKNRMLQNPEMKEMIDNVENRLINRIKEVFPAVVLRDPF